MIGLLPSFVQAAQVAKPCKVQLIRILHTSGIFLSPEEISTWYEMSLPSNMPTFCKLMVETVENAAKLSKDKPISRILEYACKSLTDPLEKLYVARVLNAVFPMNKTDQIKFIIDTFSAFGSLKYERLKGEGGLYYQLSMANDSQLNSLLQKCNASNAIKDVQLYAYTVQLAPLWKCACVLEFLEGYEENNIILTILENPPWTNFYKVPLVLFAITWYSSLRTTFLHYQQTFPILIFATLLQRWMKRHCNM